MIRTRIARIGLLVSACAEPVPVENARTGDLTVLDAIVMVTAAPDIASMYFTVANHGTAVDTLRGLSVSAGTAGLHDVVTEQGLTQMQPVGLLTIPPGGAVELRPGSLHIMLTGITNPISPGDSVEVRLSFAFNGQAGFWAPVLSFASGMKQFD